MKLKGYKIYAIFSLIIVVLLSFVFFFERKQTKEITINNKTIMVEIADTFSKRSRGLMFRDSLPENEGMLFIFDKEDYYEFWMLNTKIPLDIIWINENKEIVHIERNLQPCNEDCPKYSPNEKAMYVLEFNANYTSENGIKLGDKIYF
jgi:hypothetical protein